MPRRLTNDLLLALLLAQVLGGVLGWAWPQAQAGPLYELHRALGIGVLLLLGWKQSIALASLRKRITPRRQDWTVLWGAIAGVGLLLTLLIGLAWTLGLISFDLLWGYSPLNIHVFIGIGLVPFVAVHLWLRRRQNAISVPVRSRRTLLRVGGLTLATLVGWQAIERLTPAIRLPSGSKPTASFSANAFPAEIWLFDAVPLLDPQSWRMQVGGRALSLGDLSAYPTRTVQAVLDCTSGWWSEQVWSGVGLLDVMGDVGEVTVTSVTGHRIVLPPEDARGAILATHVGGEVLSPGHGYPVRLVVPTRRGYFWVKWVATIEGGGTAA
jgi:hypothetical protein